MTVGDATVTVCRAEQGELDAPPDPVTDFD